MTQGSDAGLSEHLPVMGSILSNDYPPASGLKWSSEHTQGGTALSVSAAMRLGRNVAFGVSVLLVMLGGAPCFGDDDFTSARAKGNGQTPSSPRTAMH